MRYILKIIEGEVELTQPMMEDYEDVMEAFDVLYDFVHGFDGKQYVVGIVTDDMGIGMEYEYVASDC